MFSIKVIVIYIFSLPAVLFAASPEDDHCVMIGHIKGDIGYTPYVYSGPPKPLENYFVSDRNMSAINLLRKTCPWYASDENPLVCCDTLQLEKIANKFDIIEAVGFARCPSCAQNLKRFSCAVGCSPHQNKYVKLVKSHRYEDQDAVRELDFFLSELFAYNMFESCKGVNGFIPGTLVMDFACGSWGSKGCSAERWLHYIGSDTTEAGPSPFKVNTRLRVEDTVIVDGQTFHPMKEPSYKCSESPGLGMDKCLCYDCKESCSAQSLTPPFFSEAEPFKIFNEDGSTVVAGLVFIFFVTISTFVLCFGKRLFIKSRDSSLWHLNMNTAVKLGPLEEVSPLRSKNSGDSDSTNTFLCDQKQKYQAEEYFCCQMIGSWFLDYLERSFTCWSLLVSRRPGTVMFLSLLVCGGLSSGLFTNFNVTTNPVDLWVSLTSEARKDMEHFNKHFEPFYRIEQIIIVPTNLNSYSYPIVINHELKNISWGPVFQKDFLLAALDLQLQIENLTATFDETTVGLKDICEAPLKPLNSECVVQSVFGFYQNQASMFENKTKYLTHFKGCSLVPQDPKCFALFGGPIHSSEVILGGFSDSFDSAQALVITFLVKNYNNATNNLKALAWEAEFQNFLGDYSNSLLNVAYISQSSFMDEVKRVSKSDSITIAMSYVIMLFYITISLGEFNDLNTFFVESKLTLGFFGVLIVLVSVASSLGLFCWLGVPATLIIVEVIPFLVLAVGVDNIFILVQTFQREKHFESELSLEHRIGYVVGKVAPSMLLSSISMSSCFFIGTLTEMPAVRIFALYAGVALLVNFFLQMTCFMVLFNLDCRRQQKGRLDACYCLQESKITRNSNLRKEGLIFKSIKHFFAPFLMKDYVRFFVMISYVGWLCSSAAVLDKIKIDLEPKLAVLEDSHLIRYFDYIDKYLSVGPPVYFVISDGYNYSSIDSRSKICSAYSFCSTNSISSELGRMAMVKNKTYIAFQPISWLDNFYEYLQAESCCFEFKSNLTHCPSYIASKNKGMCRSCRERRPSSLSEVEFAKKLKYFLSDSPWEKCPKGGKAMFGSAIEMTSKEDSFKIGSTNFMTYHTVLKTSQDFYEALRWARQISKNLTEILRNSTDNQDAHVFAYSLPHVYYEQYLTMWPDTLRSLGYSITSVAVATFLLLGLDYHSAIIVTLSVMSIVLNVMGLMYWWNISLNAISLVNLVVAVGISVEFCSHLTRSFALSEKPSRILRAQESLCEMGTSILSGITLTDCGILVLAFAKSQIFQVFYFRMYFGIIAFGTIHGLIILPVFLSLFGPPVRSKRIETSKKQSRSQALEKPSILPTNEENPHILLTRL